MAAKSSLSETPRATKLNLVEGSARVLDGRYRLIRRIGSGGMATVYEAVDERTSRTRAVKVLQPALVSSEMHRKRFTREATVTARFTSDSVVDVLDAGIDEPSGSPYLVMPLLAGRDLAAEIDELGALEPDVVVGYLTQVARALDRAHRAQVVHRDLKPANVFIAQRDDGSKQALVLDFGIAKLVDRVSTRATEAILGSPLYLAPEQVRYKKERVTERADIYALGQLAYTALVGEAYYTPEDEASDGVMGLLMEMVLGETQPACARACERRGVALPDAFDGWFARATAREPAARFGAASEAVIALAEVFGIAAPSFPVEAARRLEVAAAEDAPASPEEPAVDDAPTSRARWPWALAALGALGVGGLAFALSSRSAPPASSTTIASAPRSADDAARVTVPDRADEARSSTPGAPSLAATSAGTSVAASAEPPVSATVTATPSASAAASARVPPDLRTTRTEKRAASAVAPWSASAPPPAPSAAATGYVPPTTER